MLAAIGKRLKKPPYQELNADRKEIRLLVLKKAIRSTDDIHCELRRTTLAKRPLPLYHTVSYVWGEDTTTRGIYLHGRATEIRASAEQILRRFRLKDRGRLIWIDAVCINQSDKRERGHQVAIMEEIYSGSAHNLIWLGEDDGSFAQAKTSLLAVVEDASQATQGLTQLRSPLVDDNGDLKFNFEPLSMTHEIIENVLEIYERPWFRRLWDVLARQKLPPLILDVTLLPSDDQTRMAAEYHEAMYVACLNRRLFVTKDGRPGLGPQVMEPGDVVAVLYGSTNPAILRPLQTADHYKMCGDAYVHRIMDGQWMTDQTAQGRKDEAFYLN
ncbi:hypothetical protein B0A55_00950 [Friedmanniomyces simplex]|uniref:Heterokaryon incompatibility domain-containing protein n=1 Tax=Friedmanniomyces simplex TaxID=329884 RepID=A0A4U0Y4E6_9PEZI|nr:hypothetical protein B0A55_00950 [Friedmanniomyces simplex]